MRYKITLLVPVQDIIDHFNGSDELQMATPVEIEDGWAPSDVTIDAKFSPSSQPSLSRLILTHNGSITDVPLGAALNNSFVSIDAVEASTTVVKKLEELEDSIDALATVATILLGAMALIEALDGADKVIDEKLTRALNIIGKLSNGRMTGSSISRTGQL